MNAILNKVIEDRKGHYCHCLEVNDVYELESIFEQIVNEFSSEFIDKEIQEFIDSLTIYYLGDNKQEEEEVYNYRFSIG